MSKILLAKDIKRWKEQDANRHFDYITGLPIKKVVLDHSHKTGELRGTLDNQSNQFLGKIESAYTRFIGYQENALELSYILHNVINYLSSEPSDILHPSYVNILIKRFSRYTKKKQVLILYKEGVVDKSAKLLQKKELTKIYRKWLYREENIYKF